MRRATLALFLLFGIPAIAAAQMISIKTVPVATGDQFLLFPSMNLGMGGVTIALDDPLSDPFSNPARGIRIDETRFIGTPLFYNISMNEGALRNVQSGSARTIPVGLLTKENNRFGGVLLAWQQLSVDRVSQPVFFDDFVANRASVVASRETDLLENLYGYFMGGFQTPDRRTSVGVSVLGARLNAVEGVRLLYWQGDSVEQDGHAVQFRAGMTTSLDASRTVDVVLMHHRFAMEHMFEGGARKEEDKTNGIAMSVGYTQALEDGWQVGGVLTGDWHWHPKIPNYDVMQIPRDPGNSSAYNIGIGFARQHQQTTVGFDLIYEPIRSHTWANALEPIPIANDPDRFVPAGAKTVENFFDFNNSIVRGGVRQAGDRFDLQLGLEVHTISYHLDQTNFVGGFERGLNEKWREWTLSAGVGLKFSTLEFRYLSRIIFGTGQPGVDVGFGCPNCVVQDASFGRSSNYIIAPAGNLVLQEARIFSHQFSITIPFAPALTEP